MVANLDLSDFVKELCEEYSLHIESVKDNKYKIFTDNASGVALFLEATSLNSFSFYFLERTYDIIHHGDRTDVHVVMSLMFASFLQNIDLGILCSMFDIPHPAVEDEIWGRYIMPNQVPGLIGISTWAQMKDLIRDIIKAVSYWREWFWHFAGCPCEECARGSGIEGGRNYEVSEELLNSAKKLYKSLLNVNYGNRTRPNWEYLYDMKNEVTIIKSRELSLFVESINAFNKRSKESVKGINGLLLLDGELRNFLDGQIINELKRLLISLRKKSELADLCIVSLENMVIAVANPYIISLGRFCGIEAFKSEKELVRVRHNKESQVLFPVTLFDWNDDV